MCWPCSTTARSGPVILGASHLIHCSHSFLVGSCTHSLHVATYRCYYYGLILHLSDKLSTLLYVLFKMSYIIQTLYNWYWAFYGGTAAGAWRLPPPPETPSCQWVGDLLLLPLCACIGVSWGDLYLYIISILSNRYLYFVMSDWQMNITTHTGGIFIVCLQSTSCVRSCKQCALNIMIAHVHYSYPSVATINFLPPPANNGI